MKVIKELLASKKFVMAVLAVAAYLGSKLGFGFGAEEAFAVISPLLAAILGQGAADWGKSAALKS